jgi:hypothetical protein
MRNFAAATGRGGWHTISTVMLLRGDAAGALAALDNIAQVDDAARIQGRAMALHSLGRHQEALAAAVELEAIAGAAQPALLAELHTWMGVHDQAYRWLRMAADRDSGGFTLPFDWTSPFLRPLLDTPRGQDILRRFGVADEQLAAIRFDVDLPGETAAGSL